nr:flocculation protein FLO11-like [Vanessa tameamea]XP_026493494.1 flocculation protein FLO11-like [Vanessa tameamea]
MRSALLCVFFTLITQRGRIRAENDDFRPTPIPLNEWHHERREGRAGMLHETFKTNSPPSIAAVAAHYWEDALRHSVYLTLVRDKIDQLIAKGDVKSPNSKPDSYDSKEIDDHDLWDKIKTAPFDRIPEEEPAYFSDVTIMAKGRLLEDKGGFRFAEDERTKEKCSGDKCMDGVKAFWSVKRVRQRDQETSPGKYHYELTFSVISQLPKKQKKPYENPIRTFTVKESSPKGIIERPQEHRRFDPVSFHTSRPERAVWVHKNIAPSKSFTGRKQYFSGLDRIFSSFFSDDDNSSYESTQSKYKPNSYSGQTGSQYSKIGHVGVAVDKHQMPYPYRPHPVQHVHPPLQTPPNNQMQQYLDVGSYTTANSNPYAHYSYDHRVESSQPVKTTRPAVLPTPLPPVLPSKDQAPDTTNTMSLESTAFTPNTMKIHKPYNKYKSTPVKVNYLSEHVRPPIYNAPPGVFVTMDKKPFKPMPPLKLVHSSKTHRPNKPIDFRPSPQILDQNSDQGSFSDTAFRPITMNYGDNSSSESSEFSYSSKKSENKNRKKPSKKHESVRPHRITTATPDIITVQSTSEEDIETMDWTNVLGAFTKTTPMVSQTEKMLLPETTTHMITTVPVTTPKKIVMTTEAAKETKLSISTTVKPKKRTRPPPKFVKQEKIKKHKRITTTTTTTTTNAPETNVTKKRLLYDLTPQASSAATGSMKPFKVHESNSKTTVPSTSSTSTTTSTTTTTTKPTTTKVTTTTQTPSTTVKKSVSSTTQPKNKNRFRQSTLMYKGTSVKHDRWNSAAMQKNQTTTTSIPSSLLHRRKGSNFHGYISSTTPRQVDEEKEKNNHADRKSGFFDLKASTTKTPDATQASSNYEETADQYESNSVLPIERSHETNEDNKNYNNESKDRTEYIFQSTTTPFYEVEQTSSLEKLVEVDSTSYTQSKNKTKCKKKKNSHSTTEENMDIDFDNLTTIVVPTTTTPKTSSEIPTTSDILQELFNIDFKGNNDETVNDTDEPKSDLDEDESLNHESYSKIDTDFDFLGVLNGKKEHRLYEQNDYHYESDDETDDNDEDNSYEDEYEESKIPSIEDDDDDTEFESDEDDEDKNETKKSFKDNQEKKHSYSFLELMAMS